MDDTLSVSIFILRGEKKRKKYFTTKDAKEREQRQKNQYAL